MARPVTATAPEHPDYDRLEVPAVLVQPLPPMPLVRSALAVVQRAVASGNSRRAAFAARAACHSVRWERERATTPPADLVRVELDGSRVSVPVWLNGRPLRSGGRLDDADRLALAALASLAGAVAVQSLSAPAASDFARLAARYLRLAAPSLFQPADAAGEG